MPSIIPSTLAADVVSPAGAAETQGRRAWQTPRVVTGSPDLAVVAAEGIGDLLDHHFFVGS